MMASDLMQRVTVLQAGARHLCNCTENMHLISCAFRCLNPIDREKFRSGYDYLMLCHTLWYTYYY